MDKKRSSVLKWALILGIILVINLFINYTLSLFIEEPDYDIYCPQEEVMYKTAEECIDNGGHWTSYEYGEQTITHLPSEGGHCDVRSECRTVYEEAKEIYERNVFVILVSIGVVILIVSFLLKSNSVISISLALASVLDLVIASIRYWSTANNLIRVLVLGFALVVLLILAAKYFKESKNEGI